ncbi:MAG: Hypothetical protein BHV28_09170 [Candidatus Tokpelaia hoelldobleri]|uniref:Metallo-beta-lactamase domain-containing protein n=1 Tax=Candidatus Tokpelaia hoelldobleri TaxID=1902579 RepID=A0A1U9JUT1_9HYPH|nr:MAG: Hypothetical protein BHV28_09170 [Candidatus Tokpelaia hoelldoblerii]
MIRDRMRFTILGCGSSPGVPRPNGDWGNCNATEPKNRRYRASLLVERISARGRTSVVIDTGPDFRSQMLSAKVHHLDGVVYTHGHADHIHGVDDLRTFVADKKKLLDIYADKATLARLHQGFGYCFKTPEGSSYPPILEANEINDSTAFSISGAGGEIVFQPHLQIHGDIHSLGFCIGNVAYCTDVSAFPDGIEEKLQNLDMLIIDALQYKPHPSHFSLEEALHWINVLQPRRALLTHMHIPLDYHATRQETPVHVEPAYDGLVFEMPV